MSEKTTIVAERNGILANGEVWSARLLAALLTERGNQASWLDARRFLSAEEGALALALMKHYHGKNYAKY